MSQADDIAHDTEELKLNTDLPAAEQPTKALRDLYKRHDGVVRHVAETLDDVPTTVHNVLVRRGIHETEPSPAHQLEKLDDLPALQDDDQDDQLRADGSGDCHRCGDDATGTDADGNPVCRRCAADTADTSGGWS